MKATAGHISNGIYDKFERDDNCIFRATNSLSINAEDLEKADTVRIHLLHLNKIVFATTEEIKDYKDIKTFHGETKYYLPLSMWHIEGTEPDKPKTLLGKLWGFFKGGDK